MFNMLLGPVANIVGDTIKGFVETKKATGEKCPVCWKISEKPCSRHAN